MIRQIIHIDQEKCNGCGACANACHESAIGMINGKATLLRDDYCDGMGDCLPACPTGAITFEQREALAYDEEAVKANMAKAKGSTPAVQHTGCPSAQSRTIFHSQSDVTTSNCDNTAYTTFTKPVSQLTNWPVQIKLAPLTAPYFNGANLLIAADCTAYTYANFHEEFIRNKVTLIGCSKLDDIDYTEKLTQIITQNDIQSVTIVRMEVPCCGGLEMMAKKALQNSGKFIPWNVVTISISGEIL